MRNFVQFLGWRIIYTYFIKSKEEQIEKTRLKRQEKLHLQVSLAVPRVKRIGKETR